LLALAGCVRSENAASPPPDVSRSAEPSAEPSAAPEQSPEQSPQTVAWEQARVDAHDELVVFEKIIRLAAERSLTEFDPERLTLGETRFSADFDGDGGGDELLVTITELYDEPTPGETIVTVTLSVNGAEYSYVDDLNEGILLQVADLDTADPYKYIYIFSGSSDIDGYARIFRCDGVTIEQVFAFGVTVYAYYDGAGKVYHVAFTDGWDWETNEKTNDDWGHHIYIADTRTGENTYECPWKE
jgi:hypothetical protein